MGAGYIVWCTRAVLDGIEALSITVQSKDHSAVRVRVLSIPNVFTPLIVVIACSFAIAECAYMYVLRTVTYAQDFLASRIEAFLGDFADYLKTLEPDVFQSHVTSLVARYRESDKNIGALQGAIE